ncbi:MAG: hypothetical protein ACXV2C_03930 [Candidatus Bathyarchaeia archaeon]
MTDVIDQIVTEFEVVKKEFEKKAATALKKAFTEFFNSNPRVGQIYWCQYSPYFNDGEECVFGVHEMYANVGEEPYEFGREYEIEESEGTISSYGEMPGFEEESKNFKNFCSTINRLPDEVFELTFGNHCQVIATRGGFTVEEYEHD